MENTVAEVLALKKHTESEILRLLGEFKSKTGLQVADLVLEGHTPNVDAGGVSEVILTGVRLHVTAAFAKGAS